MTIAWAWNASRHVDLSLKERVKFVVAAMRNRFVTRELATADPSSPLGRLLAEWPDTVGILVWPYQCAAWGVETRLERLKGHQECLGSISGLSLVPGEKMVLADLSTYSPGVSLLLDRAEWLTREGHLTLSLFKDDFRAFTLSFSLFGYPETELFIGGLQGRQTDNALDLYRDLTKDFAGLRPRDFILEMLRLFALKIGARHIYAVADSQKIFRHKYFRNKSTPRLDYDDVWRDRSGEPVADSYFELPINGSRRPLEEVPTKKRSMYRRRYQMLDEIEGLMPSDFVTAERRQFAAK